MNNYIILDYNDPYDLTNFIIGKEVKTLYNETHISSKYFMYYIDGIQKDIYIKLPIINLIYNYKNIKFNQIKLPIYPSWEKTNVFLLFIKKLESLIKKTIVTNSKFISIIDKSEDIPKIKINIDNIKINSILDDISIYDLKCGGQVELICKISHIFDTNNTYGIKFNAYQLKYFPSVEELDIDFYDDEPIGKINNKSNDKPKNQQKINNNEEIEKPNISIIKQSIVNIPEQITFKPPSIKDLKNSLQNLKSTKKN